MAQTILIKRSSSTSTPTSLANGELAYSSNSNKLFVGRPGGASGDIDAIGGKYYTDIISGATAANTASKLVLRDGSGNFTAGTITANLTGNVTGNVTGSAGTATGNAGSATVLATARTIGGVSFDGSANINLPGVNAAGTQDTSGNADTATALETARTIGGVSFDGSANINLPGVNAAGTQDTSGNADTATALETARTIGGVSFDGSANINLPGVNASGTQNTSGNAATATAFASGRTIAITGDLAYTSPSFDGSGNVTAAGTLATVNSNTGSFGSATAIPVVTVNGKGLVTAVSTAAISSTLDIAADSGTDNGVLIGTDTLTVAGGTGVTTSVSGDTISVGIGQAVATTSNVTFNNVSVDGTLSSDDITAANMTASGNVIVTGNLTVNGTTTTVNSNTVNIGDAIMTLNSDETGTPSADAGLEIERGTSTNTKLYWDESAKYWVVGDGDTPAYSRVLTASSWGTAYTGNVDGGTF